MKQALFFKVLEGQKVNCLLCPHQCVILPNQRGICGVRENHEGILYSLIYGKISSIALDPIEKKPLYHFYPGSKILSIGTTGCNFKCPFCQNWSISQTLPEEIHMQDMSSEKLLFLAKREDSIGMAYTYNEPFIWYEFVYDTSKLLKENNLKNVLVTNGFVEEEPFLQLISFIDAMNIDIKSISEDFYKKLCKGSLKNVQKIIELAINKGIHVELTNLIIPGFNDSKEEIVALIDWVASISKDIPLHFSRYFPAYNFTVPPTPLETMNFAYEEGKKKLNYVYKGNIWDIEGNTTFCPSCKKELIIREGYNIVRDLIKNFNECPFCGYKIHIVG